jgi:hypothetical protein
VLILLLWGLRRLFRWLNDWSERSVRQRVQDLASKSHELVQAGALWGLIAGLLRTLRVVVYLVLAYFYLNTVLGLFPWTRPAAVLFRLVSTRCQPVAELPRALPDLAFLVVLWLVLHPQSIRRVLQMELGRIKLEIEADWKPTFRIVRPGDPFAIVIACRTSGLESAAFRGVSVFLGVLSPGLASFIANMIAGMAMTTAAPSRTAT